MIAVTLSFEQPEYTVKEDDIQLNDVIYVTKGGLETEQVLRILLQNPQSNSAVEGNYYDMYILSLVNELFLFLLLQIEKLIHRSMFLKGKIVLII